jgi:hypothetical protein
LVLSGARVCRQRLPVHAPCRPSRKACPDAPAPRRPAPRRPAHPPQILGALPALAALPRLSRLGLRRNRVATLPALDALLLLPRLRALDLAANPVCGCALLRPYLAHRLPRIVAVNGAAVSDAERARGAAIFACLDAELAAGLVRGGWPGGVGGCK